MDPNTPNPPVITSPRQLYVRRTQAKLEMYGGVGVTILMTAIGIWYVVEELTSFKEFCAQYPIVVVVALLLGPAITVYCYNQVKKLDEKLRLSNKTAELAPAKSTAQQLHNPNRINPLHELAEISREAAEKGIIPLGALKLRILLQEGETLFNDLETVDWGIGFSQPESES